uniref:SH3 domain-binding protein 5 n=2 Tax=Astyanax mexicanus TaxID=7994 RepID=A0A8B9KIN0_ASTMX
MDSPVKGNRCDTDPESPEEEEVDPRIQGELEKLNQSTDDINRWETELEDSRQRFRAVLVEATIKLDEQVKKIGKAVEDSKPYWEARRVARQLSRVVVRRADVLQMSVQECGGRVLFSQSSAVAMEKSLLQSLSARPAPNVSLFSLFFSPYRPYFELKAKYYLQLEQLKRRVDERQANLAKAKAEYRTALGNLEAISDEIHARRRLSAMGPRGCGVGAERDGGAGDEISNFKMESDGISMMSETFEEENCNGTTSEDDPETQSTCSFSSNSAPMDVPPCPYLPSPSSSYPLLSSSCPFPSSSSPPSPSTSPCPGDLEGFSLVSPVLGPRSECSGASSPECDQERGDYYGHMTTFNTPFV